MSQSAPLSQGSLSFSLWLWDFVIVFRVFKYSNQRAFRSGSIRLVCKKIKTSKMTKKKCRFVLAVKMSKALYTHTDIYIDKLVFKSQQILATKRFVSSTVIAVDRLLVELHLFVNDLSQSDTFVSCICSCI